MKKITIIGLVSLILIGTASALQADYGDIITQQQLNGIDMNTIDLECGFNKSSLNIVNGYLVMDNFCKSVKPLGTDYLVYKYIGESYYRISFLKLYFLRGESNIQLYARIRNQFLWQKSKTEQTVRRTVTNYQTGQFSLDYTWENIFGIG